ncbi:MAG: Ig-like domain-containing protein [Caldilineales bacterium]|nr:Ig-like domain-containing protein [Caldilineales bacterium]
MAPSFARFSRFDLAVGLTWLAALLAVVLVIGRGDRVGLQIVGVAPADGAADVSVLAEVRVSFAQQPTAAAEDVPLQLQPEVAGARRWEGNTLVFDPTSALAPDTTYTVTLAAGLSTSQGRTLLQPRQWSFRTRPLRILYLAPDEMGYDQLFLHTPGEAQDRLLTATPFGIWDFAPAPDGRRVAYAALRGDGGSDLWLLDLEDARPRLLRACPAALCSGPAWSPDGRRLVFEERQFVGPARLWWLEVGADEATPVFEDPQILGFAAQWSPDGRWLSFIAPLEGIKVVNLSDGATLVAPSQMGEPAAWSPQADAVVLSDVVVVGERIGVALFRLDLATARVTRLSPETVELTEDTSPAWSPDGQWLAFGRKAAQVATGSQLWLMRPDGSQAQPLTSDHTTHYGPPVWSPDGRQLLFQYVRLAEPTAQPGIAALDLATGELRPLAAPGRAPVWLP